MRGEKLNEIETHVAEKTNGKSHLTRSYRESGRWKEDTVLYTWSSFSNITYLSFRQ